MQKLVKGATKPKSTAPKAKYIEPILATTFQGGRDFEAVMEGLIKVIHRGSAWPSIYKALIVIHIMIREGAEDVTLKYLAKPGHSVEIDDSTHRAPAMGRYSRYLMVRSLEFRETQIDFIRYKSRQGFSRLHSLSVQNGLMRECGSVLTQLDALMKCRLQEQDIVSDDVLLMAFRLLVHDALSLFQVLNEGVINLLEHFFELSRPDAEQALDIYRGFRRLTSKVIAYLHAAKDLEFKTRVHVPNIKHAPTSLVSSLEMYLNDPEFDANRRQYLAEKQAHEVHRTRSRQSRTSGESRRQTRTPSSKEPAQEKSAQRTPQAAPAAVAAVAPAPAPAAAAAAPPMLAQLQGAAVQGAAPAYQTPTALQQTLAPGAIQMVSPELSSNPFWQSQQDAAQIQSRDGQAQMQMQQLHQLQMQQLEQQERIRQQIQQLEQQNQQVQAAQAQQLQAAQAQAAQAHPQAPYLEPAHTGYDAGFDFGLGGAAAPLQPQYTQPQPELQPQFTHPQALPQFAQIPQPAPQIQPQTTPGTNPFQHHGTSPNTNPFKSPSAAHFDQFAQLDQIGSHIGAQQSLIDFGQPQQSYQSTGTNPFRV